MDVPTSTMVALARFGLGRRLNESLPADPRGWLRAQVTGPDPTPVQGMPTTADALAVLRDQQAAREQRAEAGDKDVDQRGPKPVGQLARQERRALLDNALVTPAPFRERLVRFWANHFTIADRSLLVSACSGPYVREAIRPYVTGRFSDMLLAVMRHPAMLGYLNQVRSIGPDSRLGELRHKGLNENLARECLELHTVTPASGYTQADVTNFARILTGWSVQLRNPPLGFMYRPGMHEPGEIEVMGRTWPAGEQGGIELLTWLGTHPATYHHLAEKLVRHFVADEPPPEDVQRIESVLRETQGDLGAASLALIELPGAWVPAAKLRAPQDFVIACLRATGATPDAVPNIDAMVKSLGEGEFQAPFPIGWPDRAADWAGPEAMLQRVDFAYGLSGRLADTDPEQLAHYALGPLLSPQTLGQIRAAGSRREGLTLLLACPEFQRR
jgi:uncharacterized protein (DUF1800 family)